MPTQRIRARQRKMFAQIREKFHQEKEKIGQRGRETLKGDTVFPTSKHFILLYNRQENKLLFVIFPTISILTD